MNELCSVEEMIERIKDFLSLKITENIVCDWHVADELSIKAGNLSTMKTRNAMPLEEVILFCDRCGLNPLDILMKKKSC